MCAGLFDELLEIGGASSASGRIRNTGERRGSVGASLFSWRTRDSVGSHARISHGAMKFGGHAPAPLPPRAAWPLMREVTLRDSSGNQRTPDTLANDRDHRFLPRHPPADRRPMARCHRSSRTIAVANPGHLGYGRPSAMSRTPTIADLDAALAAARRSGFDGLAQHPRRRARRHDAQGRRPAARARRRHRAPADAGAGQAAGGGPRRGAGRRRHHRVVRRRRHARRRTAALSCRRRATFGGATQLVLKEAGQASGRRVHAVELPDRHQPRSACASWWARPLAHRLLRSWSRRRKRPPPRRPRCCRPSSTPACRPARWASSSATPPRSPNHLIMASPVIRKVTFTGSTPVGKQLGRASAGGSHMKRVTMELGRPRARDRGRGRRSSRWP